MLIIVRSSLLSLHVHRVALVCLLLAAVTGSACSREGGTGSPQPADASGRAGGRGGRGGGPVPVVTAHAVSKIGPGHHPGGRHRRAADDRPDPRAGHRAAERHPLRGRPGRQEGAAALHARRAPVPGRAAAGRGGARPRHGAGEERRAAAGALRGSLQARADPARSVRDAARDIDWRSRRRSRPTSAQVENAKLNLQYTRIVAPISGRTGALGVHQRRSGARQRHHAARRDQPGRRRST